jgi:hypothetical protein
VFVNSVNAEDDMLMPLPLIAIIEIINKKKHPMPKVNKFLTAVNTLD